MPLQQLQAAQRFETRAVLRDEQWWTQTAVRRRNRPGTEAASENKQVPKLWKKNAHSHRIGCHLSKVRLSDC